MYYLYRIEKSDNESVTSYDVVIEASDSFQANTIAEKKGISFSDGTTKKAEENDGKILLSPMIQKYVNAGKSLIVHYLNGYTSRVS